MPNGHGGFASGTPGAKESELSEEISKLSEKLRTSYPKTPVDCFLSDIYSEIDSIKDKNLRLWFTKRCAELRLELNEE